MKRYFCLFLTILLISFYNDTKSQEYTVSGYVIDKETSEGLAGVNIIICGTSVGTVTNSNSYFSLSNTLRIDSIRISYTGYQNRIIQVIKAELTIELEQTSVELEQITISSNREEKVRKEVPVSMTMITKKNIDEIKATSMGYLLNKSSSVLFAEFGNESQSLAIRQPLSFVRTQLVLLEDGIQIGPTSITTSTDLKEFNIAGTRNIEIIRGPASSIYGSEAVGGAINFITQNPSLLPAAYIAVQGSNFGYKRTDFNISNTFKNFGIFLGGYYAEESDSYRENDYFKKMTISLKSHYLINGNNKLTLSSNFLDYYNKTAGGIDSMQFYEDDRFSTHRFAYSDIMKLRGYLRFDHFWNNSSRTFVSVFYRNYNENAIPSYRIRRVPGTPPPAYKGEYVETNYQSYGSILQHHEKIKFLSTDLIVGLSFDYTPDNYASKVIDVTRDEGVYTEYSIMDDYVQDYYAQLLNTGGYVHISVEPLKKLKVVGAVRYDRLDYKYDNHLPPTGISGAPDETNNFNHLSPKFGTTYKLTRSLSVFANYSVGFAPPLFSQLYREVIVPVLKPSTFYNYEAGAWMNFFSNKGYIDLCYYQSDGTNEIITVLLSDGSEQSRSAGKTRHWGIELTAKYDFFEQLMVRAAGTYAHHDYINYIDADIDYSGNEMELAPHWILNNEIAFKPKFLKGFRIGFEQQYVGEYYFDAVNTGKYDGYNLFNLRTGYKYRGYEIWVNVLNITDESYSTRTSKSTYGYSYYPGPHRTILIGIGYGFLHKRASNL
ncbi:TonB-dependent receptor [candidate division KSB1 bacterium]